MLARPSSPATCRRCLSAHPVPSGSPFLAFMILQMCAAPCPCPRPCSALVPVRSCSVSSFSEINSVPFYSRVRKYSDHWEILYITMYAYNGPYNVCGFKCEPHSADVEHITVRTNADATKLEWCYFGAHGRGWWRTLLPLAATATAAAAPAAAGSAGHSHISPLVPPLLVCLCSIS